MEVQPKPVTYQSLNVILKFLDANKRFQTVHQCPTLQHLDQRVPVLIRQLQLLPSRMTVNDFEYRIGTIVQRKDNKALDTFYRQRNKEGGVQYTPFNDYSRWLREDDKHMTAGDLMIESLDERNVPDHINFKFKSCIQLTVLKKGKVQFTEQLKPKRRAHEAVKYLTTKLFGNRPPFQVVNLVVRIHGGVLRLPEGLKLNVRNLITSNNFTSILTALEPIFDAKSFPLKSIELASTNSRYAERFIEHPQIDSCEMLIFKESYNISIAQLCALRNKKVRFHAMTVDAYLRLDVNAFLRLVMDWSEKVRETGTCYEAVIDDGEAVEEIFECFKKQIQVGREDYIGGCSEFPHTVVFQLEGSLRTFAIRASCTKHTNRFLWTLKLEVVNPLS